MMNEVDNTEPVQVRPPKAARGTWGTREAALVAVVVFGLTLVVALARYAEAHPAPDPTAHLETEELYVTPQAARCMSLGFNAVVADWYWLRTLQYVGRKMNNYQGAIRLDDLSPLRIRQLAPLLDHAATLDPQFTAVYEYGAMILPAVDADAAVRLLRKGIEANPLAWRLYHHLGYIHWQRGQFREASETYAAGARVPGALAWMQVMAAQMQVRGGSREVAREIYRRMYTEAGDEQVKTMAFERLLQMDSLDERDVIRRVLADHRAATGNCARAWRQVTATLRAARLRTDASGAPLDPSEVPYLLDSDACDVGLDSRSKIPRK